MKYLARVALGAALAGGTLLSGGTTHAAPATPAPQCAMPGQLMGKFLILRGDTPSAPLAPQGSSMVVMRFPTADKQQYMLVGTGIWHDGSYRYTMPSPGNAVIDSIQTDTPHPISYSLALRCHDNVSGDYQFTMGNSPAPGPEHTAVYRLQNARP